MIDGNHFQVAAKALVIHDGKLLVLKRKNNTIPELNGLDFPGGRLKENESPEQALARELKEETGISADIGQPIHVFDIFRRENERLLGICYLCTPHNVNIKLSDEHESFRWLTLQEAAAQLNCWMKEILERYMKNLPTVHNLHKT